MMVRKKKPFDFVWKTIIISQLSKFKYKVLSSRYIMSYSLNVNKYVTKTIVCKNSNKKYI